MAATKKAVKSTVKNITPRTADIKYLGEEPEWHLQPDSEDRTVAVLRAWSWYNYYFGKKEAKEFVLEWLERHDQAKEAKLFRRVDEKEIPLPVGWLCRMSIVGFELNEVELLKIENTVSTLNKNLVAEKEAVKEDTGVPRVTIQDRLRERAMECAGEIEGLFDEFLLAGAKMTASYKPASVIRTMNVSPQHVNLIADVWKIRLAEFEEVAKGKDEQLTEAYAHLGKAQLKDLAKFATTVINDCGSYIQLKKVERKPRAKKSVSPEKQASKFKYQLEDTALKLKSEAAAKLVNSSEAWLYNTKNRKLIHVVADEHAGTFTVKGSSIIGFDTANSTMKTLRKPAEQLKELFANGKPGARKFYKDIKSTDVKFNGRSNENLIILKAY